MTRKKRFMVVPRTPEAKENGIVTGKGHRKFHGHGAFFVSDAAEADEIDTRYGLKGRKSDVWVQEDPVYEWHLHHDGSTFGHNITTHHNTFGPTRNFANAWDAFEKRRKDKIHAAQKR